MCPPEKALVVKAAAPMGAPLAPKNLDWTDAPADLRTLVPKAFAVRHTLVPLSLDGERLTVAMARPEDQLALRRLRLITRCQVQPLLAPAGKVFVAIAQLYG